MIHLGTGLLRYAFILYLLSWFFLPGPALAEWSPRVTFVCPTTKPNHTFWGNFVRYMSAAARDLGADLNVINARNRYEQLDLTRELFSNGPKPDCLVIVYFQGVGLSLLELAQSHGVPVFMVNTEVSPADREAVGMPRGRFPNFIGQMAPDDRLGGYLLAKTLIDEGRRHAKGGPVHMVGISGGRDSSSGLERNRGLTQALAEYPDVQLERLVFGHWDRTKAAEKVELLLKFNPAISVIWTVTDDMALGALDGAVAGKGVGGSDIVAGGFDWSAEGLQAVEDGRLLASVGGHFMEGAWSLIMIYDYLSGKDFKEIGMVHRSGMSILNVDNVGVGKRLVDRKTIEAIDFTRFSRAYNGADGYDFSLEAILEQLGSEN